jgi:hypothetical protein
MRKLWCRVFHKHVRIPLRFAGMYVRLCTRCEQDQINELFRIEHITGAKGNNVQTV